MHWPNLRLLQQHKLDMLVRQPEKFRKSLVLRSGKDRNPNALNRQEPLIELFGDDEAIASKVQFAMIQRLNCLEHHLMHQPVIG
jgi:hypothetical protein